MHLAAINDGSESEASVVQPEYAQYYGPLGLLYLMNSSSPTPDEPGPVAPPVLKRGQYTCQPRLRARRVIFPIDTAEDTTRRYLERCEAQVRAFGFLCREERGERP
jgi:hypothetical protein